MEPKIIRENTKSTYNGPLRVVTSGGPWWQDNTFLSLYHHIQQLTYSVVYIINLTKNVPSMRISNFGELEHKTNISSPAPVGLGCSSDVFLVPSVHVASSPAAVLEKFLAVGCSSGDGPTSSTVELIILSSVDVGFSLGCSSGVGLVPSVHRKSPLFPKLSSSATYLRFEGRSELVGFVGGFDSLEATCSGSSPTPAVPGFSALTSDFSTSLADLG
jgi:hypothetical protein